VLLIDVVVVHTLVVGVEVTEVVVVVAETVVVVVEHTLVVGVEATEVVAALPCAIEFHAFAPLQALPSV
jgi:hypothetical protein